jgi:hypothetical protein
VIEEDIKSYLNALPSFAPQVYIEEAPQQCAEPYIVLGLVSVEPVHSHDGACATITETYQFTVYDKRPSVAIAAARSLRFAIDGFKGVMGTTQVGGVFYKAQRRFREDSTRLHHVSMDFEFQYSEEG